MACAPLAFEWNGDAMVPLRHCVGMANKEFAVHEIYRLAIYEERSTSSHNHFFAALNEAWVNLPEEEADRFPTVEHFRKWLLIKAGYRDERTIVASSKAEASRLSAFIKPMDEFAIVVVRDCVVTVWTAKSQSQRAMGKKDFQQSKEEVLGLAAEMIGRSPEMLTQHARRAS